MKVNIEITNQDQANELISKLKELDFGTNWEKLGNIKGFYVSSNSDVCDFETSGDNKDSCKNLFATESQAESALAMAQLSQLMKAVNGDWVADWGTTQSNHVLSRVSNAISVDCYSTCREFLAFKTRDIADKFLSDNEELIKKYFEIK